jgi:ADP-ribose pyrophosphatase YjhB (NUDIX family)
LVARTDGRIVIDTTGRPPTTSVGKPGSTPGMGSGGPARTAIRRLHDQLRLAYDPTTPLAAIDTVGDVGRDGGVHLVAWCGSLPTTWTPPTPYRVVPSGRALTTLPSQEGARLRAAARAGALGTTVHLYHGRLPGAFPTKAERTRASFSWRPGARLPESLETRQVWGWLTDSVGRVLVLLDRHGVPSLPGGRPEPGETWQATLAREAAEEAAARLGTPAVLGHQLVTEHGRAPYIQVRMTAPLLGIGPAGPDSDTAETYRRVLVPAGVANLLLGWGPEGDEQAAAVAAAFRGSMEHTLVTVPEQGWERL